MNTIKTTREGFDGNQEKKQKRAGKCMQQKYFSTQTFRSKVHSDIH